MLNLVPRGREEERPWERGCRMLEIYWTLRLKSLNFSTYLLLFPFANYVFSKILRDTVLMVFLSNFAREIGTRATRIYAFADARAFDRGGGAVATTVHSILVRSASVYFGHMVSETTRFRLIEKKTRGALRSWPRWTQGIVSVEYMFGRIIIASDIRIKVMKNWSFLYSELSPRTFVIPEN